MRLLHTTTLDLNEFIGDVPPYAILSHTWENDEVSLQDLSTTAGRSKKGFKKIEACCAQARRDGFDWAWLDTCCIDKTSSAELSEAINSMFRWYRQARVCYVYLSDLPSQYPGDVDRRQFHSVKWFTRGWTLQELIAPRAMEFYDQNWEEIGTKVSLLDLLHDKTGIRRDILDGTTIHTVIPTGERMSWASNRKTTRQEDLAYCLLGIFGIHMPLLYGEGSQSFIRLQQEILRTSEDLSILLWTGFSRQTTTCGVLATAPSAFKDIKMVDLQGHRVGFLVTWRWKYVITLQPWSADISWRRDMLLNTPPTITSRGLHVQLPRTLVNGGLSRLSLPYIYYVPRAEICFDDPLPMYLKISHQQVEEDFRGLDMFTVSLEDNDPLRIGICRSTIPPGTFLGLEAEDDGLDVFRLPESHAHQVVLQCSVTHRESPHIYSSKVTVAVKEVPGEDRLGCFINTNEDAQASIWEMISSHSTGIDNDISQNGLQTEDEARRWSSVSQLVGAGPWSDRCAKKLPGDQYVLMAAIKMSRGIPVLVLRIKSLSRR
ncbi:Vegetative incompatibility protein HET-E-1 [Colletotrichum aenigma]|uniref:Vegetative incompatibility protein HET-E-1 n=1 Tax=Colletotrichum aenigma TaxID=1215731 RepID=UPI0018725955|nr:Vegetative incompatibility protein HET-E-1 [Colletotrichum aenigma]KAF5519434.1 Vegetative incompatibility protein HET-E-1 [Colletotrichum aenigma]